MYDINFSTKANLQLHLRKFLLFPHYWEDKNYKLTLELEWNQIKFNSNNINLVPNQSGIYCFVVKPKIDHFFDTAYLFYIGETTRTLKIRYKEYLKDQSGAGKPRPKVFELLNIYKDYLYFYFTEIKESKEIHETEERLINTFVPWVNTDIPRARLSPELRNIYES
jgi:hypothetical protein